MKPGKLTIRQNCTADQLKLIFGDTGPGVPENALPKLFDRLYRADPSRSRMTGGSGLGLAICKSIVEKHSGIIRAQNMENGGFNIEVMLPILFDPYSVNVNYQIQV
jgi:two-component system sensor histidine kinase BaeS